MQLIQNFENVADADQAAMLLESQGIVTHLSSRDTKSTFTMLSFPIKVGLWVVLDHQYDDAVKLLEDNTHVVTSGFSPEQMDEYKNDAEDQVFESFNTAILWGIVIIFILGYVVYQLSLPN